MAPLPQRSLGPTSHTLPPHQLFQHIYSLQDFCDTAINEEAGTLLLQDFIFLAPQSLYTQYHDTGARQPRGREEDGGAKQGWGTLDPVPQQPPGEQQGPANPTQTPTGLRVAPTKSF